jgi:ABC-type multidrug transport system fused ATPase/permease subunit
VLTLGQAVALSLGAYLYLSGAITIGTVYLISTYTLLLLQPLEQIRNQFHNLQQASASIGRVQTLLATTSKLDDQMTGALPSGALAVTFDEVSFGYDEGEPVLHAIAFEVQPSAVLGLLGRTGSGKTTLERLV